MVGSLFSKFWFCFMDFKVCVAAFIFLLSVCGGCSSSADSDKIIRLDVGEALDNGVSVNLSKYASAIDYIPLETVPQSMLRRSSRIFFDKGNFFIVSHTLAGATDVPYFDQKGKYLGRIGKAGRGPGEYNQLWGFTVLDDMQTSQVCISSLRNGVVYDLSGQCTSEFSFEEVRKQKGLHASFGDYYFNYIGGGRYCLLANFYSDGEMDEYLFVLDNSGHIIRQIKVGQVLKRIKNIKGENRTSISGSSFYFSSGHIFSSYDKICLLGPARDTLYTVDLESGTKSAMVAFLMNGKPYGEVAAQNQDFVLGQVLECDKFIFHQIYFPTACFPDVYKRIRVVPHKAFAWLVYDKDEHTYTALKSNKVSGANSADEQQMYDGFYNDLDGGMPFLPSYIKDGKMYQLVDASVFIEMAGICSSARMKEVAAQLTEESNPVVVVVTMK